MRIIFTFFVAAIAFAAGVWYMGGFENVPATPNIPETNIPTPNTTSTQTTQATYTNANANMIQVTSPLPGAVVSSTFTVSGKARGGWYFEASFPYEIQNAAGKKIAEGPVEALEDWMTPEFVPFTHSVTIANYKGMATLILHNDNPSGLPENAASISIPITLQ